jgi:hypothetical protein
MGINEVYWTNYSLSIVVIAITGCAMGFKKIVLLHRRAG